MIPDSLWWLIVGKRKPIYKEGVGILPLPVPYFKAFALPTPRERATQKAHADMYNIRNLSLFGQSGARMYINTHQEGVLVAIHHSSRSKFAKFWTRMTNASKRLLYINDSPHHPEAFCGRVRCKFIKNKFGEDKNDSYSLKDMRFWLFFALYRTILPCNVQVVD